MRRARRRPRRGPNEARAIDVPQEFFLKIKNIHFFDISLHRSLREPSSGRPLLFFLIGTLRSVEVVVTAGRLQRSTGLMCDVIISIII